MATPQVTVGATGGTLQNYSFDVRWSEEDREYVATSLEFPGLSGLGRTAEEAVTELRAAMEVAVEAFVEDGEGVPEPLLLHEYSGQIRIRLPKSLHAQLARLAELEGVSLNQLMVTYLALGVGRQEAHQTHMEIFRQEAVAWVAQVATGVADSLRPSVAVMDIASNNFSDPVLRRVYAEADAKSSSF